MIHLPLLFYKVYEVDAEHFWKKKQKSFFSQIYTQHMKKYKCDSCTAMNQSVRSALGVLSCFEKEELSRCI